jgi:demethoxyubiquinone hydroxylase (CLK1/Coq7/Cat5 family)
MNDNDRWLLSFYRTSEINGALFFGRIARTVRPGELQANITHHFADEASHASYWTRCLTDLGELPEKLRSAYQNRYFEAVGAPANLMEVMAITQVFEKRVIGHYRRQLAYPGTHPRVRETIERIMVDERWHVKYVRESLAEMAGRYGADLIEETLERYTRADEETYAAELREHGERMAFLEATADPERPW